MLNLVLYLFDISNHGYENITQKFYIVYLGDHPADHEVSAAQTHMNVLSSVTGRLMINNFSFPY